MKRIQFEKLEVGTKFWFWKDFVGQEKTHAAKLSGSRAFYQFFHRPIFVSPVSFVYIQVAPTE